MMECILVLSLLLLLLFLLMINTGNESTYNVEMNTAVKRHKPTSLIIRDSIYNEEIAGSRRMSKSKIDENIIKNKLDDDTKRTDKFEKTKINKFRKQENDKNSEETTRIDESKSDAIQERVTADQKGEYTEEIVNVDKTDPSIKNGRVSTNEIEENSDVEKMKLDSIIDKDTYYDSDLENIEESRKFPIVDDTLSIPRFALDSFFTNIEGKEASCDIVSCSITCFNYGVKNFADMIDNINTIGAGLRDCTSIEVTIVNTAFPNKTLSKGWLSDITKKVTHLSLKECNFIQIEERAFSGDPFSRMNYLTLEEPDIDYLAKSAFEDTILSTIEIRNNEFRPIKFEQGVFEHVKGTLTTLQLQSCLKSPESLVNITGSKGSHLSHVNLLDLRSNNIESLLSDSFSNATNAAKIYLSGGNIESITLEAFTYMRQLKLLDLSDNGLNSIENGTFDSLSHLEELDLSNNQLTTLAEGIFENNDRLHKISLQSNQWKCDCRLEWLQKMYVQERDYFLKPLFCGRKEFNDTTFCHHTTTPGNLPRTTSSSTKNPHSTLSPATTSAANSSTEKTTSTKATHTTAEDTTTAPFVTTPSTGRSTNNYVTTSITDITDTTLHPSTTRNPSYDKIIIPCLKSLLVRNFDTDLANTISLSKNKTSISFYLEVDDDNPQVQCNLRVNGDNINNMYLLVRDGKNGTFSCYYDIDRHDFGIHLDYGKPYSLCLIEKNKQQIDPYNCAAVTTPPEYNKRTWISNSSKTAIIAGVTLSIIFLVLSTAFVVFCCIRQHPELIKGNKRVIMVDAKSADAMVMPKNYEYYLPPSNRSFSEGYLTPRTIMSERHYEMVPSPSRGRRSSWNSYHSPSYMRSSLMRRRNSRYFEEVYEAPPPLPPNHPTSHRFMRYPETAEFM